jgi:alpha-L-fucosidase 2
VILVAFNTDFRQAGNRWKSLSAEQLKAAQTKAYESLKAEHLRDHQRLYNRVVIDLGSTGKSKWPVNKRRSKFKASGFDDPELFALFFQYGRYLLITGTRIDSPLPLHLQGLWNDGEANRMSWSCDYHLDTNT